MHSFTVLYSIEKPMLVHGFVWFCKSHRPPFVVLAMSFVVGICNIAKILAQDLDFYGWGVLEVKNNCAVQAHRWQDGVRSTTPEPAKV